MNRRYFLKNSAAAGMGITALGMVACNNYETKSDKNESAPDHFELNEITIDVLQEKMKSGTYTSKSITEMYLARIAKLDKQGPSLHAVIETNPPRRWL
jgi:amidase